MSPDMNSLPPATPEPSASRPQAPERTAMPSPAEQLSALPPSAPIDSRSADDGPPSSPHTWGVLKIAAAILGASAALVTAIVGMMNLHHANALQAENNELQRVSQNSHLEEVMIGLDRHFVTHAALRRYFYRSLSGRSDFPHKPGATRNQALATAEMVIDFADDVGAFVRRSKMDAKSDERWTRLVRGYFNESPVVRLEWKHVATVYDKTTACILGAPTAQKAKSWNWETNLPRASHPPTCG